MVEATTPNPSETWVWEVARTTTATRAVPPTQWPTSVVVAPRGCPVRCLRGDMGTALVFGVWVMVL